MKKTLSLLAVSMLAVSASAGDRAALTIEGKIQQSTCKIKSSSIVIGMPDFYTDQFTRTGLQTDKSKEFDIELSGCPRTYSDIDQKTGKVQLLHNVHVRFDPKNGTSSSRAITENGNLINRINPNDKNSAGPSNLEVQLATRVQGNPVPINLKDNPDGENIKLDQSGSHGDIRIPMMARYYVANEKPVIAGQFASTIYFGLDYK